MMQWLLVRHGIAEDVGPDGSDTARRLTPEGVEKTRQVAIGLAKVADRPDVVLTSPKTRAMQTAQIVADVMGVPLEALDILAENLPRAIIERLLARPEQRLAVVGHEPTLSQVIEHLCSEGRPFVAMKKAGCACIDLRRRGAELEVTLQWLAPPSLLRRVAE